MSSPTHCGICDVRFDETEHRPTVQPCGHTYCSSCLNCLQKREDRWCATCRKPWQNVDLLPTNFSLLPTTEPETPQVFARDTTRKSTRLRETLTSFKNMTLPGTRVTPTSHIDQLDMTEGGWWKVNTFNKAVEATSRMKTVRPGTVVIALLENDNWLQTTVLRLLWAVRNTPCSVRLRFLNVFWNRTSTSSPSYKYSRQQLLNNTTCDLVEFWGYPKYSELHYYFPLSVKILGLLIRHGEELTTVMEWQKAKPDICYHICVARHVKISHIPESLEGQIKHLHFYGMGDGDVDWIETVTRKLTSDSDHCRLYLPNCHLRKDGAKSLVGKLLNTGIQMVFMEARSIAQYDREELSNLFRDTLQSDVVWDIEWIFGRETP